MKIYPINTINPNSFKGSLPINGGGGVIVETGRAYAEKMAAKAAAKSAATSSFGIFGWFAALIAGGSLLAHMHDNYINENLQDDKPLYDDDTFAAREVMYV